MMKKNMSVENCTSHRKITSAQCSARWAATCASFYHFDSRNSRGFCSFFLELLAHFCSCPQLLFKSHYPSPEKKERKKILLIGSATAKQQAQRTQHMFGNVLTWFRGESRVKAGRGDRVTLGDERNDRRRIFAPRWWLLSGDISAGSGGQSFCQCERWSGKLLVGNFCGSR